MPAGHFSVTNCLILESKISLRVIPPHIQFYFINSRRRFFVYFKHHHQMLQTMRLFDEQAVRFYQRQSLLPDREELEEQGFHYLRKNLMRDTPYNEPKVYFDKYEKAKLIFQQSRREQEEAREEMKGNTLSENKTILSQKNSQSDVSIKQNQFENKEVTQILANKELIQAILQSFNVSHA